MWEISRHCTHEPHFKTSVQVFQSVKYTHGAVILSYKVLLYLAPASLPNLSLTSLSASQLCYLSVSWTLQHCPASVPWQLVFCAWKEFAWLFFLHWNVTSSLTAEYKMVTPSPIILLSSLTALSTICNYLSRDHICLFMLKLPTPKTDSGMLSINIHWMNEIHNNKTVWCEE